MSECFLAGSITSRVDWRRDFFLFFMQGLPEIICLTDRLREGENYFSAYIKTQIINKGFVSPTEVVANPSFEGGKLDSAKGVASIDCPVGEELPIGNRHSREVAQSGSGVYHNSNFAKSVINFDLIHCSRLFETLDLFQRN